MVAVEITNLLQDTIKLARSGLTVPSSGERYPEDDIECKMAKRIWHFTAHALKRELWDSSCERAQHPHLWAEITDDSTPEAPFDAIADRRAEVEAVEAHIRIIKERRNAPGEWKILRDIHWDRSQVTATLVRTARKPHVPWNPHCPALRKRVDRHFLNYGNTKKPLEDKFSGAKSIVKMESQGGPKSNHFFEQVCILEHIRMASKPEDTMPALSLEEEDWNAPLILPKGLKLSDCGERYFDPPAFKLRAREQKAIDEVVDVGVPMRDKDHNILSEPLINIEDLIVPQLLDKPTNLDQMNALRYKPSGQEAHCRQLAALELSLKLHRAADLDVEKRAGLIKLNWWCELLGPIQCYSRKNETGGRTFLFSAGAMTHCAQCWLMNTFSVGTRTWATVFHRVPLEQYPVEFLAGFEVAHKPNEFRGCTVSLTLPKDLPPEAPVCGLYLEIIKEETDLIKHALEEGVKLKKELAKSCCVEKELDGKASLPSHRKTFSGCSRRDLINMLLNKYFPGDENVKKRIRLLNLQKARQMQDAELLKIINQIDGPIASKFADLKSHLEKKSKLPDSEDSASDNIENDDEDGDDEEADPKPAVAKGPKEFQTPEHYKTLVPEQGKLQKLCMWARFT